MLTGFNNMMNLIKLLVEQSTQTDGQVVERAQAWLSTINCPYFRINPPLCEPIPLNETDNAKLVDMLWQTMVYLHQHKESVSYLLDLLKAR